MGLVKLLEMVIALRSAVFVVFILFNPDQTALGIGKGAIFSENTILKKMQPILIQLLDYPLHTSGHGGKCKCYKKRCTWGRRGEPLAPPSSIEQSGGKAKCGEFEGRDEERWELLLGENGDFGGGRTKEGVEGVVGF